MLEREGEGLGGEGVRTGGESVEVVLAAEGGGTRDLAEPCRTIALDDGNDAEPREGVGLAHGDFLGPGELHRLLQTRHAAVEVTGEGECDSVEEGGGWPEGRIAGQPE